MSCLYILEINPLPVVSFAIIFSHSEGYFNFIYYITLEGRSKRILLRFMSKSVPPIFSSKSFTVSGLTFKSLIHLEFIFVCGVRKCSNFIVLHVAVQFPCIIY